MDVPMELSRIVITELGDQQVIFLKEKDGERNFPILIGINEALAIDRRLKGMAMPRPMTHDLLAGVIEAMGGAVEKIVVSDIRHHTFIATLYIRQGGKLLEIDSRPSDAIALGSAFGTPIFVAEHVLTDVLKEPTTRQERLQLLRDRMQMLVEQMRELKQMLADQEAVPDTPQSVLQEHRRHLEEMQKEHDAIQRVLKKLG